MQKIPFNDGWGFIPGETSYFSLMYQKGTPVTLPHDAAILSDVDPKAPGGKDSGFYNGGYATYVRQLEIPEAWENQRVLLAFDGAYMNTEVTVDSYRAGFHHYGYTPFTADLTELVQPGKTSRVIVKCNNAPQPSGRWYTGTGLYRGVQLLHGPRIHIAPDGIFAHTRYVKDGKAYLAVEVTLENHTVRASKQFVKVSIHKDQGRGMEPGERCCDGFMVIFTQPGQRTTGRVNLVLENPELWELDSPSLYRVQAALYEKREEEGDFTAPDGSFARVTDTEQTLFGIRTITIERDRGLELNGKPLKLKGGCVHHDNGILGAVSLYDAEYRKMKLHKDAGFNAIRCAHNPPSAQMLEACDRLGLLVMDEAFAVWTMPKNTCAYHLNFATDWKRDLAAMVLRDRNHPSVFIWSIGNEITERYGLGEGYELSYALAELVRSLDSTRPVTAAMPVPFNGLDDGDMQKSLMSLQKKLQQGGTGLQNLGSEYSCSILPEKAEAFLAPLDVYSFNYLDYMYEEFGEKYPNAILCGTESYPANIAAVWDKVERLPYVIGDFTWTSFDYIGEAGLGISLYLDPDKPIRTNPLQGPPVNYPWRLAFDADFDLCGMERPQLALRKCVWGDLGTYLYAHNPENYGKTELKGRWGWSECYPGWTFPGCDGKMTKIDVFSAAEEVELILNGESLGRKAAGRQAGCQAQFEAAYVSGTVTAVSYTGGREISRVTYETHGEAAAIRLTPEKTEITADGQSLCYVLAELVDSQGRRVLRGEDVIMTAAAEGAAFLAGFGNGRPCTEENYTTGSFTTCNGCCMAVLRSTGEPGEGTLTVKAEGFETKKLTVTCKA